MDEAIRKKVFLQIAGCMENLVGGSGHLTSYALDWEQFRITAVVPLGDGLTEYVFSTHATAQGEFMDAAPEAYDADSEYAMEFGEEAALSPEEEEAMMEAEGIEAVPVAPSGEAWISVASSIVLDAGLQLALDAEGNARLKGYTCLPPAHWHPDFR